MDCKICGKQPEKGRTIEYCDMKTGEVKWVECEKCYNDKRVNEFKSTSLITTSLWLHASLETYETRRGRHPAAEVEELMSIVRAVDSIKPSVKRFERSVWFGGLQQFIRNSKWATFSGKTPIGRILAISTAGRFMTTLNMGDNSVTLITDESSPDASMGIQGIDAKADDAIAMIDAAVATWQAGKLNFKRDKSVSLF